MLSEGRNVRQMWASNHRATSSALRSSWGNDFRKQEQSAAFDLSPSRAHRGPWGRRSISAVINICVSACLFICLHIHLGSVPKSGIAGFNDVWCIFILLQFGKLSVKEMMLTAQPQSVCSLQNTYQTEDAHLHRGDKHSLHWLSVRRWTSPPALPMTPPGKGGNRNGGCL